MNKLIKRLAVKAGAVVDSGNYLLLCEEEIEKFAELIVKECFSKLEPYLDDQFIGDIESELKEHFGEKE